MSEALFTFEDLVDRVCPERTGRWKVVRHKDNRRHVPDLFELSFSEEGMATLEFYQRYQSTDIFGACRGIFSFVGLPQRRALFLAAYRVGDGAWVDLPAASAVPRDLRDIWKVWAAKPQENVVYELTRDPRFAALERRAVIDWGGSTVSWHQWKLDKPVVELRDPDTRGPCPDYRDIDVSLSKLAFLYAHEQANPSWKERLSAVGGIYLLSDTDHGRLYVGKADGADGFWGRWKAYAQRRSGNVRVDEAFDLGELRSDTTRLSILDVVPRAAANHKLVDRLETRWKQRLCSRSVDNLNRN